MRHRVALWREGAIDDHIAAERGRADAARRRARSARWLHAGVCAGAATALGWSGAASAQPRAHKSIRADASSAVVASAADTRSGSAPPLDARPASSYATPLAATCALSMGIDAALWAGALSVRSDSAQSALLGSAVIGLPVTWLARAVVHWGNGEAGRGFLALGGSFGSFALGALPAAYLGAAQSGDSSIRTPLALGVGFGMLFQAIWAYDDVENRSSRRASARMTRFWQRAPALWVARLRGGALLELGGAL